MEGLLSDLYSSSGMPVFSAVLLGLLNAIAPCPMTINLTAIAYLGKDIIQPKKVFMNGLFYAIGTALSYASLAIIIFLGADQFKISTFFQQYSEKIAGPALFIIGLSMTGLFRINFPAFEGLTEKLRLKMKKRYRDAFLLGLLLALAFCPYNGMLYFGILIPLSISSAAWYLPLFYALATAIPVVFFGWLLAFTVSGISALYNNLKTVEFYLRKGLAFLFMGIGLYLVLSRWFSLF